MSSRVRKSCSSKFRGTTVRMIGTMAVMNGRTSNQMAKSLLTCHNLVKHDTKASMAPLPSPPTVSYGCWVKVKLGTSGRAEVANQLEVLLVKENFTRFRARWRVNRCWHQQTRMPTRRLCDKGASLSCFNIIGTILGEDDHRSSFPAWNMQSRMHHLNFTNLVQTSRFTKSTL